MPDARFNWYGLLALIAVGVTAWTWSRIASRPTEDRHRMAVVYLAALGGGLIGAKLAFLFAEGWIHRGDWVALVTGRSITGALLGGYAAVELAKWMMRDRTPTGDFFALIAPLGIALGRVGCILQGCCTGVACEPAWWTVGHHDGVAHWPAAQAELLFNLVFLAWALLAARAGWLPGNRFHVYLIAYGLFRLVHEPLRAVPPLAPTVLGPVTGYQVLAAITAMLGGVRLWQRRDEASRRTARIEPASPSLSEDVA